ncbi:MAG: hypothetical protein K8S99_02710 [Planctomycetes bacterium]|nr:hypothetical protein [Planctomycetota bacterium]
MATHLHRSIDRPIREGLSSDELWHGPDKGLIWCWERGRQKRIEEPELATRADRGELVVLAWIGGVEKKLKLEKKLGALQYLATWQGLRNENLDIGIETERLIVCTKTEQTVAFSAAMPTEETP